MRSIEALHQDESGVAMLEYIIATALLVAGLVVVNATLIDATKTKAVKIAETNVKMTPCDAGDGADVIVAAIENVGFADDVCR